MNRKTIDRWKLSVHRKLHNPPASLNRTHIARINIVFDLILLSNLNSSAIRTLVDVFMDIFAGINRNAHLKIEMTFKLCR
jgi:hypothetical protein